MDVGCKWCAEPAYPATLINWHCPGCRARMLAGLPSREARAGWLRRWRDAGEGALADQVIEKLKEMAHDRQGGRENRLKMPSKAPNLPMERRK